MNESQPQAVGERVFRNIRLPRVNPKARSIDSTPKIKSDTDPTKTSRGRAALKRRNKKNKLHRNKFKNIKEFVESIVKLDTNTLVPIIEDIDEPISISKHINQLIKDLPNQQLSSLNETIHNVWDNKPIEYYVGVSNNKSNELKLFEEAQKISNDIKEWGAPFSWIERIRKSNFTIYKVYGDYPPSNMYLEHKELHDRNVILPSEDRANIIQIIYGDHYGQSV